MVGILLTPNLQNIFAAPFSTNIENDVYDIAQGGSDNGIPTANESPAGTTDINEVGNFLYALAGLGTPFTNNRDLDVLFKEPDSIWTDLGGGNIALIGMHARFSTTLGIYTDIGFGTIQTPLLGPNSGNMFTGDGTIANPFPAKMTNLLSNQQFGLYIDSVTGGGVTNTFFSESNLNPSLLDHTMTFDFSALSGTTMFVDFGAGPVPLSLDSNTFLVGWEDKGIRGSVLGDDDYNDMIYLLTSVSNIPPVLLFGSTGSLGYEDPTIGKSHRGIQVVENGICIDIQCWTVTADYHQDFELVEMLSDSTHTISTTVFCQNGVVRCNYVAFGVSPYGTNINDSVWKIILQKDHKDKWIMNVVDPDGYLGEVTSTTQIVNDDKHLSASATIEFKKPTPGMILNVEVRDSKGGYRDFKFNDGIEIKDAYAYPQIDTSYDPPLDIKPLCHNENPNKRYTCAFAKVKEWTIKNAEVALEQIMK